MASLNNEPDDDSLMVAYGNGDEEAFAQLYERHKDATWRYARRQLNEAAAADCQQAIWLKLIEQRTGYEPQGRFRSFLFSLAHNAIMDEHRRVAKQQARIGDTEPEAWVDESAAQPDLDRLSRYRRLQMAIKRLPSAQRDAVMLKAESGLSLGQIAEVTGSNVEAIKSRLRYALGKLRAEVDGKQSRRSGAAEQAND
ncbi:MAG: sigma-70 family RNA polymerase sigma factor [Pseudomonadaceae bacterium]|nr:sigma-70 family RNA polymerase sigma factor [Pseudomonadaceae bacterium]